MLKKSLFSVALAISCAAMLLCTTSCSLFQKGSRARVNTLMVSGNFLQPRLLCEIAQFHTHQPVFVFSPADEENSAPTFYYLSPNEKGEPFSPAQFYEMVEHLNPRMVVFLGDETFYPTEIITDELRSNYRVMQLSSSNWEKNAMMLGDILGQGDRLYKEYSEYYSKFQEAPDKQAELPQK